MKLTDEQIIKALEEWRKELVLDYQRLKLLNAPMDCFEESHGDTITNLTNALDLINRQKEDIERLEADKKYLEDRRWKELSEVRAEAINEFAEKVIFEIVNRPSEFTAEQATADFLSGSAHRQNEIIEIIEKMAVNCDDNNI